VITFPKDYFNPSYTNFAPRIGFAYNIRPNTVIRGGFGTFYSYFWQSGLRGAPGDVRPDVATVGDFATLDNGITAPFHMSTGMPVPAPFDPSQLNAGFGAAPVGQRTILSPYAIDRNLKTPYSIEYNLNVQRQWSNGLFIEVGGIATLGRHIFAGQNVEQIRISQVQAIAATGRTPASADRPYPQFTGLSYGTWPFSSHYTALLVKGEKRFSNGLSFLSNYTWSKWLNNTNYQTIYDLSASQGPASGGNGMRAQNFVFAGTYELPFGPHRPHLSSGFIGHLAGGWNVSPILQIQSGAFLTPTASPNLCFCFGSQWANRKAGVSVQGPKRLDNWFNLDAFSTPDRYSLGNTGEGVIVGPGLWNLDLSVAKDISFTERYKLSVRGEFFNALNHPNFGNPFTSIPARNPTTGQPLSSTNYINTARDPRRIQLGLRFAF
jgi:hypothetical protein